LVELSLGDIDSKELVESLVDAFTVLGKVDDLLEQSLEWEINSCASAQQMFRQDSASSSFFSAYLKLKTEKVIKQLLHPLIADIVVNNVTFDNVGSVSSVISHLLDHLIDSVPSGWPRFVILELPPLLLLLFRCITTQL
jgi:hypothetical protein